MGQAWGFGGYGRPGCRSSSGVSTRGRWPDRGSTVNFAVGMAAAEACPYSVLTIPSLSPR